MSEVKTKSREYFNSGYCCAESVLMGVTEAKGIKSELIPKIATGFCSGLAKTDSLCGAFSGGILAINLFTGRTEPGADRTLNYQLIQNLTEYFHTIFGATLCSKICGCNLATDKGIEEFEKQNKKELCDEVVEKSSEFVLNLLEKAEK